MKIAIASSGLGHIRRGVESWAKDLAVGLHRRGEDVTLFQAGTATEPWQHNIRCCRRFDSPTRQIFSVTKHLGGWRYGCGSEYEIEQTTFSFPLWRAIRKDYDILHVQDPRIARILDVLNQKGWSRPRVILGNGTDEAASELRKYTYLQHLSPHYQQLYEPYKPPEQLSFLIPNLVDTTLFRPGDRSEARKAWNLPQNAFIGLSVVALKKYHKRCDYLIQEFAAFRRSLNRPALLVLAGAREEETPEVVELGKSLLGDSLVILESLDRAKLPSLYQAADFFAIASLHEMISIAILEALASGLPITCNRAPIFEWVAGPAAQPEDISQPGGLVRQWQLLTDPQIRTTFSTAARIRADKMFSESVVVNQVLDMYGVVMRQ